MFVLPITHRRCLSAATGAALALVVLAPFTAPSREAGALELPSTGISLWHDLALDDPTAQVMGLTHDIDGNEWYDDAANDTLVRIDSATHAQQAFPLGASTYVTGMVGAPDGTMWFSDGRSHSLGRVDPVTSAVTWFPLTGVAVNPTSFAVGSDGNIWFADPFFTSLVRVDSAGGITLIPEPSGEQVLDVVAAPDGRIWYSRTGADRLGAYDPASGLFADLHVGPLDGERLTLSHSGSVWIDSANQFTEVAPDGRVSVRPLAAPGPVPVHAVDLTGGDLAGDDDVQLSFLDQEYGFGTIDSAGRLHFSRLDAARTNLDVDGAGHLWINDLWGHSLQWR
ncbi:hypothetical protein [Herbiconiux sp.]|uniref:Vgb family protein n=1 Tax=Herbiconiux sp. TaxID=1871186 RepID=UPI0025BB8169|nr:hypothetical protein [Herbiconiux sp.]